MFVGDHVDVLFEGTFFKLVWAVVYDLRAIGPVGGLCDDEACVFADGGDGFDGFFVNGGVGCEGDEFEIVGGWFFEVDDDGVFVGSLYANGFFEFGFCFGPEFVRGFLRA